MTMNYDQLRKIAKTPDVQAAAHMLVDAVFSEEAQVDSAVAVFGHQPDEDRVERGDWDYLAMLALLQSEPAESAYHGF
jgi:hypothetical protein